MRALLKQRVDVNAAQGDGATRAPLGGASRRPRDRRSADPCRGARECRQRPRGDAAASRVHEPQRGRWSSGCWRPDADANAALLNGETVLMTCARAGDASAVKALLARGADVNAREREHRSDRADVGGGATPSGRRPAAHRGPRRHSRPLRSPTPQTVVGEQTQRAGREELNYTVLRGGATPLLFAARGRRRRVREAAARRRARTRTIRSRTASARWCSRPTAATDSVAALLLEHGADPNALGSGYTALHAAILRSDLDLVKALLARGANPNLRITKGTPMRRDTTDWNLPATLIGSTPYLLAARFLEPDIMRGARGRRRRSGAHACRTAPTP